jgi:hypothetical protein
MRHWSFHFLVSLGIAISNTIVLSVVFRFKTQDGKNPLVSPAFPGSRMNSQNVWLRSGSLLEIKEPAMIANSVRSLHTRLYNFSHSLSSFMSVSKLPSEVKFQSNPQTPPNHVSCPKVGSLHSSSTCEGEVLHLDIFLLGFSAVCPQQLSTA